MATSFQEAARGWCFIPACFATFLIARLAVLLFLPVVPTSDAEWYVHAAMGLASGQGYHEGPWPTAFWPIGYPLFLAAVFFVFGHQVIYAQFANLALSCGVFFMTYRLARHIFGSESCARVAVLLLTIYPNQIAYTGALFSETFATFLLLLACDMFMTRPSPGRTAISALLFGYGALVKAQFLFLPGVLLLIHGWGFWRSRREFRRIALLGGIFAVGMAAVLLPMTVRNYQVFHRFIPVSTNGGWTFLTGNNPEARGDYTPETSLAAGVRFSVADQVAADKRAYAIAIDWIKNNPRRFLELMPLKIWRLWAPDGEGEWWFQRGYAGYEDHVLGFWVARVLNQFYYAALLAGAATALLLLAGRRFEPRPWTLLGALLAAYITLVSIAYSGQSRFHIPAMPFVMIYDGWLLTHMIQQLSRSRKRAATLYRFRGGVGIWPVAARPRS